MKTFQNILSEAVSQKLKNEIKSMGPLQAKEMGITTDDYVDIVYDGNLVEYVSEYLNPLLNLTISGREENGKKYIIKAQYRGDSDSPLSGYILTYYPKNPPRISQSEGYIFGKKWEIIQKYLTKFQFMDFMNGYYDLNMQGLYTTSNNS